MEPIADLTILRQHLDALAERGLVVWLSPPGRGRMLTHGLLPAEKLEKVKAQLGMALAAAAALAPRETVAPGTPVAPGTDDGDDHAVAPRSGTGAAAAALLSERIAHLEATVADLQARLAAVEKLLE
jgi:hypothetical protein